MVKSAAEQSSSLDADQGERIEIPREAYIEKDWFWDRQTAEGVVPEIKKYIADGGEPFNWRGHTHTKPPLGSKPEYLEEFDLPEKRMKAKRWAPCPCCSPEFPKYGRNGKIAWFPSEGIIRLLGPDCFKSLDREGHEEAKRRLEAERRRRQVVESLLLKIPCVSRGVEIAEASIPIARALDDFRGDLHAKFSVDRFFLWEHVFRDGALKIMERQGEFRQDADGAMRVREIEVERIYARLNGYQILNPQCKSFTRLLENSAKKLREYCFGPNWRAIVESMDDDVKRKVASEVGRSLATVKSAVSEMRDMQKFVDRVTINTLRAWGRQVGCPLPRYFEHCGDRICFGRSEFNCISVAVPVRLQAEIQEFNY